ncbi:MAG: ribosomal protein S18-alanine N-acetyltransferase [Alphaproteobacteria bacterium]|nr:ribosomal protein S18-alanine N-acetyltransferase [Alphaproteobacteria bacterium]
MNRPVRSGGEFSIDDADLSSTSLMAVLTETASDDPWSAEALARILALPRSFGLIAHEAGQPLGFLLAQCAAGESEIINLAVAPAARRQGIGGALVAAAMARARRMGAQTMFLEVARDNATARALYDRIGFVQVGIRSGYYRKEPNNYTDALILRRELITTRGN